MSKENIKSILREGVVNKNIMGVDITRPKDELIIMRGIPGSGKSTKAKQLVGNGVIHSTDDVIESMGDYRKFFEDMIANKDFAPLSRAHAQNFKNAVGDMKKGITPIVIDNTNLRADEPKNYIEAALNMGYDDKNIKFVEVGTGGVSAEELAQRNTHGVPLDKIKSMIQTYKSAGPMTVEKVIGSKSRFGGSSGRKLAMIVLDDKSRSKLLSAIGHLIPEGWEVIAHHMTINFGKGLTGDQVNDLGKIITLRATEIGKSDMAMAVKVEGYVTDKAIPHITIAINKSSGAKPAMSNDITDWNKMESYINLAGTVSEQKLG